MQALDLRQNKVSSKGLLYWAMIVCTAALVLAFCTLDMFSDGLAVFRKTTKDGVMVSAAAFVGVCWVLDKIAPRILTRRDGVVATVIQLLLSVPFTVITILGVFFESNPEEGFKGALTTWVAKSSFALALCGGMLFFFIIIRLIWSLGTEGITLRDSKEGFLSRFFGKHLYRNCILVMILCWLPQYIIRFPGVMPYDAWQSLAMHFGYTELTTQHPLIWNVIMVKLTELGVKLGVNWLGFFIICLVNHILAMVVVPYVIFTIKKMGMANGFLAGVLVFYAVLPAMSLYASTVYNDFIYSLAILVLTVELVYYLYDRKTYFKQIRHGIITVLAVFSTILRYNGLYTMLVVLAVIGLRELILLFRRRTKLLQSFAIVVFLVVPLLGGQLLQNALNTRYDARAITSRAMLAMPIQQTVRVLGTVGDQIPKEDYDAIHAVLTWTDEEYAEKYNPRNFDSVKESFKTDASTEEILGFVKAWAKLLVRYPKTCFMAAANQTYYLFSPLVQNVRYYESLSAHSRLAKVRYDFDASEYLLDTPVLEELCAELSEFHHYIFPSIPVLGLTVNQAVYTILLAVIFLCGLLRKDRRVLVLTFALLVTLGITAIGPAVYNHPRYIYPIMFSMPVLLAAFMFKKDKMEANV